MEWPLGVKSSQMQGRVIAEATLTLKLFEVLRAQRSSGRASGAAITTDQTQPRIVGLYNYALNKIPLDLLTLLFMQATWHWGNLSQGVVWCFV